MQNCPLPQPEPGESYEHFVIRAHRELEPCCPDPMERNELVWAAWERVCGPTAEEQVAAKTFPQDRYVRHRNVCVFAEHSAVDGQGQPRTYDLAAMVRVARGCNDRIADFDGFAPICDGHTPGPEEQAAPQPEILGYAGPFRLGMIGRQKPRWAVFSDEWHMREASPRLAGKPRRSVELWTFPNDPARMYFDPIAALGAETPRLSLPVRYRQESRDGVLVERYCFASPGASNTFVRKPVKNQQQPAAPQAAQSVEYAKWEEAKHPRNAGKFAPKGTSTTGAAQPKTAAQPAAKPAARPVAAVKPVATPPAKPRHIGAVVHGNARKRVANAGKGIAAGARAVGKGVKKVAGKTLEMGGNAAIGAGAILGANAISKMARDAMRAMKSARNATTGPMMPRAGVIDVPFRAVNSRVAAGQQPDRFHRLAEGAVPLKFSLQPNPQAALKNRVTALEDAPDFDTVTDSSQGAMKRIGAAGKIAARHHPKAVYAADEGPVNEPESQAGAVPAPIPEEGNTMPLTNDDLAQLLNAFAETPQFKFLDHLMAQGEAADDPGAEDIATDEAEDQDDAEAYEGEDAAPVEEPAPEGEDDLSDVQDLLVDEGAEAPPEGEPDGDEAPPEEAPTDDAEPTEKNILPALPALGAALATPAGAATAGAAGGYLAGRAMKSMKASGQQPAKYSQLLQAHNRLVQEHGRLAARTQGLLREKTDAQRAAVIQGLARRYPDFVDVQAEMGACLYSQKAAMSDKAFRSHIATVEKYAQKAAQVARARRGDIPMGDVDRQPVGDAAEKYAARLASEAVKIYTDSLSGGKPMTYEEAKQAAAKRVKK